MVKSYFTLLALLWLSMSSQAQCDSITVTEDITHPQCFGQFSGGIVLTVSGGQLPYMITLLDTAGIEYPTIPQQTYDLGSGWYYYTVVDASGCTIEDSIELIDPPEITVDVTLNHPNGAGLCDGSIIIDSVLGWQGDYLVIYYEWSLSGASGPLQTYISDLCFDNYNLTIYDDFGCTASFLYDLTTVGLKHQPSDYLSVTNNKTQLIIKNESNEPLELVIYNSIGQIIQNNLVIPGLNKFDFSAKNEFLIYTINNSTRIVNAGKF